MSELEPREVESAKRSLGRRLIGFARKGQAQTKTEVETKDRPEAGRIKRETIGYRDVVSVPRYQKGKLTHFGGEIIAKFQLGGAQGLPSQELHLYHVEYPEDRDYASLVASLGSSRKASRLLLVFPGDDKKPPAVAFIPETHPSVIGRDDTLRWREHGTNLAFPDGWTPFNDSVSRRQMAVHVTDNEVAFIGTSQAPEGFEPSRTVIEATNLTKRPAPRT